LHKGYIMAPIPAQSHWWHMSWGAIIAGVVVALVAALILLLLGAGVGAVLWTKYQNPLQGFALAGAVWLLVAMLVATLTGAYLSGRAAPTLGWLHGLLSWAVMTLLCIAVALSLAGSLAALLDHATGVGAKAAPDITVNLANQQMQRYGVYVGELDAPSDQQLRATADAAAKKVASATWWGFAVLLLGAVAAVAAGSLGFRQQKPVLELDRTIVARVVPTLGQAKTMY
jgi:hypothetical protein